MITKRNTDITAKMLWETNNDFLQQIYFWFQNLRARKKK